MPRNARARKRAAVVAYLSYLFATSFCARHHDAYLVEAATGSRIGEIAVAKAAGADELLVFGAGRRRRRSGPLRLTCAMEESERERWMDQKYDTVYVFIL